MCSLKAEHTFILMLFLSNYSGDVPYVFNMAMVRKNWEKRQRDRSLVDVCPICKRYAFTE